MKLATIDILVLLLYVAAVIAFGCWFVRKSGTTKEFMAAGGSLPGWAVGLSIFGTFLSSNTFLGVPGKAYGDNFNGFVFSLSLPFAALIAARYFVPFYRHGANISAYHHLEERFGAWARTYAAICYLLTQIARMGAILYGVALGLQALTGWDVVTIILITGVLVTLYTLLGGIEAVIWTDVAQSIVLMGGAVLIFAMLLFGGSGSEGPTEIMQLAATNEKFSLGSWAPEFQSSTVWVMLLYGLFINLNNFGVDQSFVQRYHTADSDAGARRALWFGALLYIPIALLFFSIGAAAHSWYQMHPEELAEVRQQVAVEKAQPGEDVQLVAAGLSDKDIGDKVLPHFIANQLPAGLAGLLIAAIFAAAMSSVDTSLNSSATIVLKDVYERYVDPQVSERRAMLVLRISTVVAGVIGVGVAVLMIGVKSILEAWWVLQGVFAGGVLGLFLLGMATRSGRSPATKLAVLLGVGIIGWMTLSPLIEQLPPYLQNPLHANMTIVIGTLAVFLLGVGLNQLFGGSKINEPSPDPPASQA